jgi:hypothetical protein
MLNAHAANRNRRYAVPDANAIRARCAAKLHATSATTVGYVTGEARYLKNRAAARRRASVRNYEIR